MCDVGHTHTYTTRNLRHSPPCLLIDGFRCCATIGRLGATRRYKDPGYAVACYMWVLNRHLAVRKQKDFQNGEWIGMVSKELCGC